MLNRAGCPRYPGHPAADNRERKLLDLAMGWFSDRCGHRPDSTGQRLLSSFFCLLSFFFSDLSFSLSGGIVEVYKSDFDIKLPGNLLSQCPHTVALRRVMSRADERRPGFPGNMRIGL